MIQYQRLVVLHPQKLLHPFQETYLYLFHLLFWGYRKLICRFIVTFPFRQSRTQNDQISAYQTSLIFFILFFSTDVLAEKLIINLTFNKNLFMVKYFHSHVGNCHGEVNIVLISTVAQALLHVDTFRQLRFNWKTAKQSAFCIKDQMSFDDDS